MRKESRKAVKLTVAGLMGAVGAGAVAQGATYIVPPDIDQYKQKTDQTYQDMYQNENSALGKTVKKADTGKYSQANRLRSIATPNAIVKDSTVLAKSTQANIQGVSVPEGTKLRVYVNGRSFVITYKGDSSPVIDGDSRYIRGNIIAFDGSYAKPIGGITCTHSGKYGCDAQERRAENDYLNVVTGEYTKVITKQSRSCSNYGKYGCRSWGSWSDNGIVSIQKRVVDLASSAIKGQSVSLGGDVRAYGVRSEKDILEGREGSWWGGGGYYGGGGYNHHHNHHDHHESNHHGK